MTTKFSQDSQFQNWRKVKEKGPSGPALYLPILNEAARYGKQRGG
jgi:hypothetical protein